ncbi:MAG: DUF3810 family protein [Saprospiraceae bacterium]
MKKIEFSHRGVLIIIGFFSLLICLGTIAIGVMIYLDPKYAESYYFYKVYLVYRHLWKYLSNVSPWPLFFFWLLAELLLVGILIRAWAIRTHRNTIRILGVLLIFAHISWFYLSWGFNYSRKNVRSRLGLYGKVEHKEFLEEFRDVAKEIRQLAALRPEKLPNVSEMQLNDQLEHELCQFLESLGLPSIHGVRCRIVQPSGCLLIFETAGIFWPFSGEGQVDKGLHWIEWPFTMAHELAHGMGWTNEGECNFLAFECCIHSSDPWIRYSAAISYWKYLASSLQDEDSLTYVELQRLAGDTVLKDLADIREQHRIYPSILPEWRDWLYERYLEVNKVEAGLHSYHELIPLVILYRKK